MTTAHSERGNRVVLAETGWGSGAPPAGGSRPHGRRAYPQAVAGYPRLTGARESV